MRIFFGVFWGSVLVASVGLGKMPSVEKMVFPSVLQCKTSRRNEASVSHLAIASKTVDGQTGGAKNENSRPTQNFWATIGSIILVVRSDVVRP